MNGSPEVIEQDAPETAVTQALAVVQSSPLPVFRGQEMAHALVAYKELQRALDAAMPDQLMQLDGRAFRKKGYWRAVAVAFNLTLEPIEEHRETDGEFDDGRPNFGYIVTYRATAPNGRSATGDGSCFAIEKAGRFKCPHPHAKWKGKTEHYPATACPDYDPGYIWRTLPAQATSHNVRSHAHTRAFNRAVSNLVGFGEVSAEEVERETSPDAERPPVEAEIPPAPEPAPAEAVRITKFETARQGGHLYAQLTLSDGREAIAKGEQVVSFLEQAAQAGTPLDVVTTRHKRRGSNPPEYYLSVEEAVRWREPKEQKSVEQLKAEYEALRTELTEGTEPF